MTRKRRNHTEEFKIQAVKMVLEEQKPKAEVYRTLGISGSVLDRWIEKYGAAFLGKDKKNESSSSDKLAQVNTWHGGNRLINSRHTQPPLHFLTRIPSGVCQIPK